VRFAGLDAWKALQGGKQKARALRVGDFGGLIKYVSPVRISVHGALLRTADKTVFAMPDGGDSLHGLRQRPCMAGFAPAGRFTGAGYDKGVPQSGRFRFGIIY
jgi:hypothetical protein